MKRNPTKISEQGGAALLEYALLILIFVASVGVIREQFTPSLTAAYLAPACEMAFPEGISYQPSGLTTGGTCGTSIGTSDPDGNSDGQMSRLEFWSFCACYFNDEPLAD